MERNTRITILIVLALLIAAGAYGYYIMTGSGAARGLVEDFGRAQKDVALLAADASSTIATSYAKYAAQPLVVQWQQDPKRAPGRLTSSPWPERIDITSMTPQGAGYIVEGELVYMTSTGESGRAPVLLQVVKESGAWRIVAYQEIATSSTR